MNLRVFYLTRRGISDGYESSVDIYRFNKIEFTK